MHRRRKPTGGLHSEHYWGEMANGLKGVGFLSIHYLLVSLGTELCCHLVRCFRWTQPLLHQESTVTTNPAVTQGRVRRRKEPAILVWLDLDVQVTAEPKHGAGPASN
jgi:hypothetical protein